YRPQQSLLARETETHGKVTPKVPPQLEAHRSRGDNGVLSSIPSHRLQSRHRAPAFDHKPSLQCPAWTESSPLQLCKRRSIFTRSQVFFFAQEEPADGQHVHLRPQEAVDCLRRRLDDGFVLIE